MHFCIENGFEPKGVKKDRHKDGEDRVFLGKHLWLILVQIVQFLR